MSKLNNLTDFLTDIANTIRTKKGITDKINPQNFASEISSIQTENYLPSLIDGSLTTITTEQLNGASAIKEKAFYKQTGLISIGVPSTVSSIEPSAFEECSNLQSVVIQGGTKTIKDSAFKNCTALNELIIPVSATDIASGCLSGCTHITTLTLPTLTTHIDSNYATAFDSFFKKASTSTDTVPYVDTVNIIGSGMIMGFFNFYNCNIREVNLASRQNLVSLGNGFFKNSTVSVVDFPETLQSLGDEIFKGCEYLSNISLPASVTTIGNNAFEGCSLLTHIYTDNNELSVGNYAFKDCTDLQFSPDANAIKSMVSIGDNAFENCTGLNNSDMVLSENLNNFGKKVFAGVSLNSLTMWAENEDYYCSDNCLISKHATDKDGADAYAVIQGSITSDLTNLDSTVSVINDYAFYTQYNFSLDNLVIPDFINTIGEGAFMGCHGLSGVTFSTDLTTINKSVFEDCTSINTIDIPNYIESIGQRAFYGCTNLTEITIQGLESGQLTIGANAFNNIGNGGSITIRINSKMPPELEDTTVFTLENTQIIVPQGAKVNYTADSTWNYFNSIIIEADN